LYFKYIIKKDKNTENIANSQIKIKYLLSGIEINTMTLNIINKTLFKKACFKNYLV